jgi:hypothetical protein
MLNKNISVEVVIFDIIPSISVSVSAVLHRAIEFSRDFRKNRTRCPANPTAVPMLVSYGIDEERDAWMNAQSEESWLYSAD